MDSYYEEEETQMEESSDNPPLCGLDIADQRGESEANASSSNDSSTQRRPVLDRGHTKWALEAKAERPIPGKGTGDVFLFDYSMYEEERPGCMSRPPPPFPRSLLDPTWGYDDNKYVRMPFAVSDYKHPKNGRPRHELVREAILSFSKGIRDLEHLQAGIGTYNSKVKVNCLRTFISSSPEGMRKKMMKDLLIILTDVAKIALQFDELFMQSVPVLSIKSDVTSVSMSQQQAACILSHAFFCTFPPQPVLASFSFCRRHINMDAIHCATDKVMVEKMKFILYYFSQITHEMPAGTLSIRKSVVKLYDDTDEDFSAYDDLISSCGLTTSTAGCIEDADGFLQVDFANEFIGGGVLGRGAVQEEIRFLISPELIVSLIICERMADNMAYVITGAQRFSNYNGYASSLQFVAKNSEDVATEEVRDHIGRANVHVVAIDAKHYKREYASEQYRRKDVNREIIKAYAGFRRRKCDPARPIATGNWGCGVFNGDAELKSLIQLMAAAIHGRDLVYFTFNDHDLAVNLQSIYNVFCEVHLTVGQLYTWLVSFNCSGHLSLFQFVAMRTFQLQQAQRQQLGTR